MKRAASFKAKTGVRLMLVVETKPLRSKDEIRLDRRRCHIAYRIVLP